MKSAGFYDPYLPILGGAERFVFSIAQCLKGYDVTFFAANKILLKDAEQKFAIPTSRLKIQPWPGSRSIRNQELRQLDLFFYVTDGSLFFSSGAKNILIIQSSAHMPAKSLINAYKLKSWKTIICYSQYVAGTVADKLGRKAQTLFVPVDVPDVLQEQRDNIIVSVGRFFPHLHNKKQKEMVKIFKELLEEGLEDTVLYLVGSIDPGAEEYFEEVKRLAQGYPIKLVTESTFDELREIYRRAKVYWHAAGFGEDLFKHPEKAEHFGVSTIEAMAHGVVPVVFSAGGQKEIVTGGHNGYTWTTQPELKRHTLVLLGNEKHRKDLARQAYNSSQRYTHAHFCRQLYEIIEE